MTYRTRPRMKPCRSSCERRGRGQRTCRSCRTIRSHWNGETVALVLADTQEQADHAASLVAATYDGGRGRNRFRQARRRDTKPGDAHGEPLSLNRRCGSRRDARLKSTPLPHATPQPQCDRAPRAQPRRWEADTLIVHDATQMVAHAALVAESYSALKTDQVRVISPYVGGGFGGKTLWSIRCSGAAASKLVGRPVRLTLTREGVYRMVGGRDPDRTAGGDRSGGGWPVHGDDPCGRVVTMSRQHALPSRSALATREQLYAAGASSLDQEMADLDMLANTFMRAPGEAVGTFGLECAVDELAGQLGHRPGRAADPQRARQAIRRAARLFLPHIVQAHGATGAARFGWIETQPGNPAERARRANG